MRTIVVVDDELDIADALACVLEEEGYTVVSCYDGCDARATIAARQPDLVLMDVMMPGITGLDVVRAMRKNPDLKEIPVILMSALEHPAAREDVDVQAFIRKPFTLQALLDQVKDLLAQRKEGAAPAPAGDAASC